MGTDQSADGSDPPLTSLSADLFLDAVPKPVVVADEKTGRVLDANTAAVDFLERSCERLRELALLDLHPDRTRGNHREALAATGTVSELEDGSPIVVDRPETGRCCVDVTTEHVEQDGRTLVVRWFEPVERTPAPQRERRDDLFDKTQEIADVGAWEYDVLSDELWWSEYVAGLLGYDSAAEPSLPAAFEAVHPDDRDAFEAAFDRAVEDGIAYDLEIELRTRGDGSRWIRAKGDPQTEDGDVVRVRGTIQGVTGRKERERELERASERLRVLFDKSPNVIIVHDVTGTVLDVNETHVSNLGYTREELLSMHVSDFEVGVELDELEQTWKEMDVGERRAVAGVHRRKDGSTFPASVRLNKVEIDGDERIIAVSRDVTERNEREQELERFQRAIEAAAHAIFLTDRDGTITYVNPAFESITGYTAAEAVGETPNILNSGRMDQQYFEEQWETVLSGQVWEEQIVNRRKSGEIYHAQQTIAPITDDDGTVREFVAIQTDITERKEQNQQLQTLDRVLRHNLRNELTVVEGYASQIEAEGTTPVDDYAERILESTTDLLDTAEKGRKITKLLSERARRRPIDLVDVVEREAAAARGSADTVRIETDLPARAVATATGRIDEAIAELLENAIEHTDRSEPTIDVGVRLEGETVRIRIADDGPGIEAMERRILDETRAEEDLYHGSGLGLWFVYWIVRRSGGSLEFEANAPRGSVVTIELDRALSAD